VRLHAISVYNIVAAGYHVAHMAPSFLPWHRKLSWLMEYALCNVTAGTKYMNQCFVVFNNFICCVGEVTALPYWDFTDPASTIATLSDNLMGGNNHFCNSLVFVYPLIPIQVVDCLKTIMLF
jgi:hypothetical protein